MEVAALVRGAGLPATRAQVVFALLRHGQRLSAALAADVRPQLATALVAFLFIVVPCGRVRASRGLPCQGFDVGFEVEADVFGVRWGGGERKGHAAASLR